MSHTPGPWEVNASNMVTIQAGGASIAQPLYPIIWKDDHRAEFDANARLIATAPELLEALKQLVARCDGDEGVRADGSNIQTMAAHAAIAKAEGA